MLKFQMMMGGRLTAVVFAAWKLHTERCLHTKAMARRQMYRGLYEALCAWRDWALAAAQERKLREAEEARQRRRERERELFLAEQKRRAELRAQRERERIEREMSEN